ncbi:RNA-binding protein, putative [Plasmodium chabaudi chabaudi]|uniref:RNA-binding protein, putative n=1 Tax=Plasmodium chabaudi chabaudi TaxID=31271 RepID=A0A4V0KAP9_PLACU|nr:RNA-binding protein, putative [Plasmodium chabaudi chabaudi]VTZ70160.1 RNA-binding protein, putative [Plasmodium chabaudi chabaudi]|eukprot:XP_741849.2 RNA-binding protein, putative [Plasmodium chabaudi chabaudi]
MDSLYGDLPPPVSTKNNNVKNNDNNNSSGEVKSDNYIELNKYLITPSIIQKKIANIKNVNKELEIGKADENPTKNNNIDNNGENSDVKKNDSKKIEIININQSIQDDLKKISGMLKKMHHGAQDENALANKRSYQEKLSNRDLYGDIKSSKLYEGFKSNNLNRDFKNSGENATDELYDKYFIANANEDYDPSKPNDLNKIIKERKRKKIILLAAHKKKMEKEKENERHQMENNMFPFMQDEQKLINNINDKNDKKIKIKPLIGDHSISQKRIGTNGLNDNKMDDQKNIYNNLYENNNMPNTIESKDITAQNSNENVNEQAPVKKDFATRMMEKMGWKKGEGLGKDKQGIKAPLILQKVDKRSGVIVQAPIILKKTELANEKNNDSYDDEADAANSANNTVTRIIQLTNLVTIDEVDDTLKEEIEEEGSKFGNLLNINIVTDPNLLDALAVKIYCEYESSDQAKNAFNTFKERTFAGRKVKVSFVNEQEYLSQEQNK